MDNSTIDEQIETKEELTIDFLREIWSGFHLETLKDKYVGHPDFAQYYVNYGGVWTVQIKDKKITTVDPDSLMYINNLELLSIRFNNSEIVGYLMVLDSIINGNFQFYECNISIGLLLDNLLIKEIFDFSGSTTRDLIFQKCRVLGECKIINSSIKARFQSTHTNFYDTISFAYCSDISTISFNECRFLSYFSLYQTKIDSTKCDFQHCIFLDQFSLNQSMIGELIFFDNVFLREVYLYNSTIANKLECNISEFNSFTIIATTIDGIWSLRECQVYQKIHFSGISSISSLDILDNTYVNSLEIEDIGVKKLKISDRTTYINRLVYQQTSAVNFNIIESNINLLEFAQVVTNKDSVFHINQVRIHELKFKYFVNLGYMMFNSIVSTEWIFEIVNNVFIDRIQSIIYTKMDGESTKICIYNSDLGKAQFIDCDLSQYNRFELFSSKIIDIYISGSRMPQDIATDSKNLVVGLSEQRLGYAQIKKVLENRGDSVSALHYRAKELTSYRNELKKAKKQPGERFVLWSNECTNTYETNWFLAFKWSLGSLSGFYIIYCLMLGFYPEFKSWDNADMFGELFSRMFEFLNPIRRSDFLENEFDGAPKEIPYYARIWDFISRIFISFFVYQLVQAFRKNGKK